MRAGEPATPGALVISRSSTFEEEESKEARSQDVSRGESEITEKKSIWCCSESPRKRASPSGIKNIQTSSYSKPQANSCAATPCTQIDYDTKDSDVDVIGDISSRKAELFDAEDGGYGTADDGDCDTTARSPIGTIDIKPPPANTRRGAKCPMQNLFLSNGNQLYAPYLQNKPPVTTDALLQRRLLTARQCRLNQDDIQAKIKVNKYFQRPVLLSDMQAFKAANPGSVFEDFVSWYGNPAELMEEVYCGMSGDDVVDTKQNKSDEDEIVEKALSRHFSRNAKRTGTEEVSSVAESEIDFSMEAYEGLTTTRNFWKETWDDAKPIPVSEQQVKLFDAPQEVEKVLYHLENLSPSQLMNHVLEINFSIAY